MHLVQQAKWRARRQLCPLVQVKVLRITLQQLPPHVLKLAPQTLCTLAATSCSRCSRCCTIGLALLCSCAGALAAVGWLCLGLCELACAGEEGREGL